MKKKLFIYFIAVLVLSGCSTNKTLFYSLSSHVDYRLYSEKGFFLTEASSVNFDYKPIASVLGVVRSGYSEDAKATRTTNLKEGFISASPQDALDKLYSKAIELGANGIINLKIINFIEKGTDNSGYPVELEGYSASGMAISK